MALFRFHRGGVQESLQTTIIVKSQDELLTAIRTEMKESLPNLFLKEIAIEPYSNGHTTLDPRIGWYTQLVIGTYVADGIEKNYPIGYLSEPL